MSHPKIRQRPGPVGFRNAAGFTLLELLVVLLIIGLLASYVAPKYFSQIGKSSQTTAKAQIEAFDKALDQYRIATGHYPSNDQGLAALVNQPSDEAKWNGPYLKKGIPLDPWERPYIYKSPGGSNRDFDVSSYGKDGVLGGTGEDADIVSWN